MRYLTTLILLVSAFAVFTASASTSLRDAFDYYKVNPAGTYETRDMHGWVGQSIYARNKVTDPRLLSFQPPSLSAGCGGIDFFAGSFSIVTKDEIVQMARGIAAGAPGYFFNLMIDSVCPNCGANMKELQRKLESWNQLTQNSCERFWDMATNKDKRVQDRLQSAQDGEGNILNQAVGLIPDYGSFMSDKKDEKSTPQKEMVEQNTVAQAVENKVNRAVGIATDLSDKELFATIFGTLIITHGDDKVPDIKPLNRLITFEQILKNPRTGNNIVKVWRCPAPAVDPKCLTMSEQDYVFPGLIQSYKHHLVDAGSATCKGIFPAIKARNIDICTEHTAFFLNYKYPYVNVASTFDEKQIDSIAEHFALVTAKKSMMAFYAQIQDTFQTLLLPGNDLPKGATAEDLQKLAEIVEADYQKTLDQLNVEIKESLDNLHMIDTLARLSRML